MLKLYKNDPVNDFLLVTSGPLAHFWVGGGIQGGKFLVWTEESISGWKRHSKREKAFKEGKNI